MDEDELISLAMQAMDALSDEGRVHVMSHFCDQCGTEEPPCYACRDIEFN